MQIFFIKLSADVKFLLNLFETKYHFNITKSSNIKQFMFCGTSHKKTLVLSVSKVSWVNKLLLETWQGPGKVESEIVNISSQVSNHLLISLTLVKWMSLL